MITSKLISNALFSDKSLKSANELKNYAGIKNLATMEQTHSDVVLRAKEPKKYLSDGIITENPNLGLLVQTADCLPILLKDNKTIGAVHSGWRGLKNNIIRKVIKNFDISKLAISVGPHAQSCCYEVKEDVSKYFMNDIDFRNKKLYLNMSKILKDLSKDIGFQIEISSICTICDSSYNSYRENRTLKRQYGIIWQ